MINYENPIIMRVAFSDGTFWHYILESYYNFYNTNVEDWKLAFKEHVIPEVVISEDLIPSIVDVTFFTVGNFIEC